MMPKCQHNQRHDIGAHQRMKAAHHRVTDHGSDLHLGIAFSSTPVPKTTCRSLLLEILDAVIKPQNCTRLPLISGKYVSSDGAFLKDLESLEELVVNAIFHTF
ncbi:unnamed protein product [Peronospora belbahrii]|uniref:Uncharacterized protein n=1 Tax=Peronospora belbahrii TaxID=622444 RepID=A0ABN8CPE7_9STRA|nr:unnamed protein product [Peronospora belbahrii]